MRSTQNKHSNKILPNIIINLKIYMKLLHHTHIHIYLKLHSHIRIRNKHITRGNQHIPMLKSTHLSTIECFGFIRNVLDFIRCVSVFAK